MRVVAEFVETLKQLFENPYLLAVGLLAGSILAAWLVELVIARTLVAAAARTKTDVDDAIVEILRRPVFLSIVFFGLDQAAKKLPLAENFAHPIDAALETIVIIIWSMAVVRVGNVLLQSFSARARPRSVLQPTTLPVFDIFLKTMVTGAALYFIFLAWKIDLTAWLASAGIIGVAVGFAAKDTLANLFSGIFIIADGSYKVKDWIVLDNELRGEVTRIGIRSTRILTPDDVEINVPNAVIGNAQLINESGGPYPRQRVRILASVAYGSDVDQVREVILGVTEDAPHVIAHPAPAARFMAMGDSGLHFELWVWINEPAMREQVVDDLTTRVYKALNAARIEIPFPKHDVYIRQMPGVMPVPRQPPPG